ncbi:hypothetical protein EC991_000500 [Linnemannia zychae]|nr:hypothetical protein EC991_000500 [Linnemannia zychae]
MQVQSSLIHSPYHDIQLSSLFSVIQSLVNQSARGFQTFAAGIPLRKIAKVIYYACLVVGVATFVATATSTVFFSVPVVQIAGFVARYLGRMALVPIIEQVIMGVAGAGLAGATFEYALTKKQLSRKELTIPDRVSELEEKLNQVMAMMTMNSSNTTIPTPGALAPAISTTTINPVITAQSIPTQAIPAQAIPAAATSAVATPTPIIIPTPFIHPPATPEPLYDDSADVIF